MVQGTNDRYVSLEYLVKDIADALANKIRWWEKQDDNVSGLPHELSCVGNDLRRDIASAMNTHGYAADGIPSILSHVEQAIVNCEITPRSTANGLPATDATLVVNHFRNWYLTIDDADVLLRKAGLPARYTVEAVAVAGGMFPEEVAFSLSMQPTANKDIQWHLEDIQRAFERGELVFYKHDVPQRPEEWIPSPYAEYMARFTGDTPRVPLLSETSLFTKPGDVNEWLEKRGAGYMLPVCDAPAQAGDDIECNGATVRNKLPKNEPWMSIALEYADDIYLSAIHNGKTTRQSEMAGEIRRRLEREKWVTPKGKPITAGNIERWVLRYWMPPEIRD